MGGPVYPFDNAILAPEGLRRPYVEGDMLDFGQPLLWTADDVFSVEECRAMIDRIESLGCAPAPITTADGFSMRPDIRNNTRVMIDDHQMALDLFARIVVFVPKAMCNGMEPVGVNERFRCYRYAPGQRFAPHYDGAYVRSPREESLLTFMIYLNQEFSGGDTAFLDLDVSIRPRTGMALLFQHRLLHEGSEVTEGVKYVLRSDIMYRRRR